MNPLIKGKIKLLLQQNSVSVKRSPGVDEYTVYDENKKPIVVITNGWDYGQYTIDVNGKKIADVEWISNLNPKPTGQTKDVLDLIEVARIEAQKNKTANDTQDIEARKKLTKQEAETLAFLEGALQR